MTLKESWSAFLSFLNISQDKAVTTELSAENLDSLHNEFTRLKSDNSSLVQAKQEIDQKLSDATTEIATLKTTVSEKDQEIANLKTEASGKDSEITQLKEQVANLRKLRHRVNQFLPQRVNLPQTEEKRNWLPTARKMPAIIRESQNA